MERGKSSQRTPKRTREILEDTNDSDAEDQSDYSDRDSGEEVFKSSKRKLVSKKDTAPKKRKAPKSSSSSSTLLDGLEDVTSEDEDDSHASNVETGQISRIYVENFMCHRKMTIKFGKHVNFVTGQNGSGKSAIVVAIQLCLGASARVTGRGSSLGALIREGSDGPAVIKVSLLNTGDDRYTYTLSSGKTNTSTGRAAASESGKDEYITVERRINKGAGGSGYKIWTGFGDPKRGDEVISSDRRELDKILNQFNIYVSNPCCVLTQEESKKFIHGNGKDQYEFFLKATGLERTREALEQFDADIKEGSQKIPLIESKLQAKADLCNRLKKELKELEAFDQLESNIKKYKAQLLWLEVQKKEAEVEDMAGTVQGKEQDFFDAQEVLREAVENLNSIGNLDEIQASIDEVMADSEGVSADVDAKRKAHQDKTREIHAVQAQHRKLSDAKKETVARINNITREIKELRDRALANSKGQERELMESLDACERVISDLQVRDVDFKRHRDALNSSLQEKQRELANASHQVRSRSSQISEIEGDLRSMAGDSSGSRAKLLGPAMPAVLQAIQQRRSSFRGEVLGPLSLEVKLQDGCEAMSMAIEAAIGKMMTAFVVTNREDEAALERILREKNANLQFAIVRTDPGQPRHRVPQREGVASALSALVIDNDLVFNVLVDKSGIENILVAKTEADVMEKLVARNGRQVSWRFDGVSRAITYDGTTVSISNGNTSSEMSKYGSKDIFIKDTSELIRRKRLQMDQLTEQIKELQVSERELAQQCKELKQQLDVHERGYRAILDGLRSETRRKDKINSDLIEFQQAAAIDTTSLEEELDAQRRKEETLDAQIQEKVLELAEAKEELALRQAEKESAERRLSVIVNKQQQLEVDLNRILAHQSSAKQNEDRARKAFEQRQQQLTVVQQRYEDLMAQRGQLVETVTTSIKEMLPEWDEEPIVLTKHDTESKLKSKITAAEESLDKERRRAGLEARSKKTVADALALAREDRDRSKEEKEVLERNVETLKADFESRKSAWSKQLKGSCKSVKLSFDSYMQKKGQSGTVEFNHKDKLLTLKCQTDNTDSGTTRDDVRQLSGGERSYTTLCLLMALGRVMECPFRIMDEYDVFLDELSRRLTLNTLLEYSKEVSQARKQLVIITPHTLNGITTSSDVRIQKMRPPERSGSRGVQQTTID